MQQRGEQKCLKVDLSENSIFFQLTELMTIKKSGRSNLDQLSQGVDFKTMLPHKSIYENAEPTTQ